MRTYVKTDRLRCILDKTEEADRLINELGSRKMRNVVIMMAVYRETLGRREARVTGNVSAVRFGCRAHEEYGSLHRGLF